MRNHKEEQMDNNQQSNPQSPQPTPGTPPPVTHKAETLIAQKESGSNNLVILLVAILMVLFLGAGIYFYMNTKKLTSESQNQPVKTVVQPNTLEKDVQTIDLGDIDKDFTEVDQDLSNL